MYVYAVRSSVDLEETEGMHRHPRSLAFAVTRQNSQSLFFSLRRASSKLTFYAEKIEPLAFSSILRGRHFCEDWAVKKRERGSFSHVT